MLLALHVHPIPTFPVDYYQQNCPSMAGEPVMTYSPRDKMALQAGRLGLSHWAGPSVTGSASESQGLNGGIIVVILAKGRGVPLAWEFMYMTEEVI